MRWLIGRPKGLAQLGEYSFRWRGQVDFQVQRTGRLWGCHEGFQTPPNLERRKWNREWDLPANDRGLTACMHEAGWLHSTKNGCLRHVCRDIERELARLDQDDRRYLEAKGVRLHA